jgi:predicted amidohydrolase
VSLRAIDSFEEFARQCEFFVETASEYRADFVVFPELFTVQLLSLMKEKRPGIAARQLAEFTPQYLDLFGEMSIRYNVNIIGGSQFAVIDDRLFNVSYLFRRDGTMGSQAKLHVTPSERKWWGVEPGKGLEVFETDRGKIAILICYDIEFPEICRVATGKGADMLFVPFNTDERTGFLRVSVCARARAVENEVYVVISGCVGNLPFVQNADIHYAESAIYTPSDIAFDRDGIAASCTPNIETMLIHDIDLERLRRHRYAGNVQNWKDRRSDLYRIEFTENGEIQHI